MTKHLVVRGQTPGFFTSDYHFNEKIVNDHDLTVTFRECGRSSSALLLSGLCHLLRQWPAEEVAGAYHFLVETVQLCTWDVTCV